jgi:exopolysaccharide biosynthesis protein
MTLYELQDLLLELGAESALNLCGGNSATLYYQGTTFSPTPCVERMIANAIIFK